MLEFQKVTKQFGKLVAVSEVSFTIESGKISGLIGPNGSGKTTAFNLATGFLRPSSGRIVFGERDIARLKPHQVARHGLVRTFQLTSLFPEMTAREAVRIALMGGGANQSPFRLPMLSDAPSLNDCDTLLELLDLHKYKDVEAKNMPSGLQRTLSIATALATRPSMLMLDEPLAGLNPTEKAELVKKVIALNEYGMTIFIVEHDIRSVMALCSKIVVFNFGAKIAEGTPAEIQSHPEVMSAYLGHGDKHA